jgi:predicted amidohydrolase YtcJ
MQIVSPADLVIRASIRTGDPAHPRATAAAVKRGHVVGLDDDVNVGAHTRIVDLEGATLLPAFGDGHIHALWGGLELAEAPIRDCKSVEEIVEAVRRFAVENPKLEWLTGGSYDPTLASGGLFDRAWLDEAIPDRPVVLQASDHHCAWVNSEALRRAGVSELTPDPPGGYLARRSDGSLLGTLVEWEAMKLVMRHVPERTEAQRLEALCDATKLLAAAGLVWALDAAQPPSAVPTFLSAAQHDLLSVRFDLALRANPEEWPAQRASFLKARELAARESPADAAGDPFVRARTVKFFADGIIEVGTAALLESYADEPHNCGLPVWSKDDLAAAVCAFDGDGFDVHIHAIGDGGVRNALDAVEAAVKANGPRLRRPVVAHTQLVHRDDILRFASLGVIANFEPLWACLDAGQTQLTLPRLGPGRGQQQYAMATLKRSDARLSFGSDWPVSGFEPLAGLATAVSRRTADGTPDTGWLPAERLMVDDAFAAYASGTAYQAREEARRGAISVGMRADVVAIGADPWALDPMEWREIEIVGTWLAGQRTYG